jgi:IS5 family transposase
MKFEFVVASRTTKKTRTKNETRFRCDSKKEKKNRIRRRSKKKKNRIRRRSKKKNRIWWHSKKEKNDCIQRRCRREFKNATNDSKFESLIRLRTNSISTTTIIAYLINVAKHKKRILYKSFFKLHFFSLKL